MPPGGRGRVAIRALPTGLDLAAAFRPRPGVTVVGYAERLWGRPGWTGAAEVQWVF